MPKPLLFIPLLIALIGAIIILSWVPPVSRDALTHHLAVPKLYLKHGGIYEIPSIVFSYYPMNLDLLYMIPLYFGNDIAPKYIHFIFALLTAWLIFSYLKKRLDKAWALFGMLFFLSLPIIVKLCITVYVDLGLVFFSTASIMSLLKWIDSRFQLKFLILSGTCCGLALGTKYNGLIVFFILAAFIPLIFISDSKKKSKIKKTETAEGSIKIQFKAISFGALFGITALLVFSPWMIRNYVWQGNPIYPLYNSLFKSKETASVKIESVDESDGSVESEMPSSRKQSLKWTPFAIRKVVYNESWWEIALIPVRIFFQGQDDNPRYFDGKLSPFLFLLPFFAFIPVRSSTSSLQTEKKIFVFFTITYILYAFSQASIRIRYIAPVIPPLVVLATLGLHQLVKMVSRATMGTHEWVGKSFVLLMVAITLSLHASYLLQQFRSVDPWSYLSGRMSRDEYISKYRPEFAVFQYSNRYLPHNAKILGLFLGNRLYYSERPLVFGVELFKKILSEADSGDALCNDLLDKGFTHLMIRYDLFNPWINRQFDDSRKELLKLFFAERVKHVFSRDGYGLYELNGFQ